MKDEDRLFPFSLEKNKDGQIVGCKRAWQIVHAPLPEFTEHWLRAFGEDFLYGEWDHDLFLIIVARAFGSYGPNYLYPGSPQHPRWNPDADINSDGVVDGSDIILTTRMFGHH